MKGGKSEIQKKESILYFRLQKNKTKKNKKKTPINRDKQNVRTKYRSLLKRPTWPFRSQTANS